MKYRGYLFATLSAALYGSIGLLVKNGISGDFSPIDLIMLQMIITMGFIIIICLCISKYRKELILDKHKLIRLVILGGGTNTGILVFNYQSYKYLSIPVATVILYTYPALVAIASAVIFKQKVSKHKVMAIAGTFAGCLMVINIFSGSVLGSIKPVGVLYAFLAAVSFTAFNLYAAKILDNVSPVIITFYNAVFTFIVLCVFNYSFFSKLGSISIPLLTNTTALAVFCGTIPSLLFYYALKDVGSIPVSILGTLEIPIAAILAFLVLGETISAMQISGVIISIISVILLKLEKN